MSSGGEEPGWEDSSDDSWDDGDDHLEATDTSDEEEVRNTKGNIPLEWYEELSHFGYDIEGKKIAKPTSSDKDEVCSH